MRVPWLPALGASLALALAVACGGDSDGAGAPGAGSPVADALAGVEAEASLALKMRDIAFGRDELEAAAGRVVAITIENTGTLIHDFTIDAIPADISAAGRQRPDDFAVHVALKRREEAVLLLRVTEPGDYAFYCSVPGHRQVGMEGTLIVR